MPIFALGDKSPNLPQDGRYYIAHGAMVMGDVTLGQDVSIWFNVVIRGDNDPIIIGARTNIQDGSVLHSDVGLPLIIGSDVTVGHNAMIHSCSIGDNSLIGIGAVVLNAALIGKNTIVGAHALVAEGKSYPDGVLLLGSPAKIARELTPQEIGFLSVSAQHYVINSQRFKRDLRPI